MTSKAYFAVKQKSQHPKVAPRLLVIVQSSDDAIAKAEFLNTQTKSKQFFATIHYQ